DKADRVVFASQAASEEGLAAGLPQQKIAIIGVGIETDLFKPSGTKQTWRQELGIRGQKVLLFIGRINFAEKGIGYLLEAMPEIMRNFPSINLVVIGGGGESERLVGLITKLGISDHVQ